MPLRMQPLSPDAAWIEILTCCRKYQIEGGEQRAKKTKEQYESLCTWFALAYLVQSGNCNHTSCLFVVGRGKWGTEKKHQTERDSGFVSFSRTRVSIRRQRRCFKLITDSNCVRLKRDNYSILITGPSVHMHNKSHPHTTKTFSCKKTLYTADCWAHTHRDTQTHINKWRDR